MDIAHTRRVLQSLREAGIADTAVFDGALAFLRLMQRHPTERRPQPAPLAASAKPPEGVRFDGGFYFSPVVLDANKGAVLTDDRGAFYGSYATATCDGLLALLAAGLPLDDARIRAARDWLLGHERLDHAEGIPCGSCRGLRGLGALGPAELAACPRSSARGSGRTAASQTSGTT